MKRIVWVDDYMPLYTGLAAFLREIPNATLECFQDFESGLRAVRQAETGLLIFDLILHGAAGALSYNRFAGIDLARSAANSSVAGFIAYTVLAGNEARAELCSLEEELREVNANARVEIFNKGEASVVDIVAVARRLLEEA